MLGISYGGISQLFTAQTKPPSLAAIAPLSVIDQTQTTLYPGGVLNTGFAVAWAQERQDQAKPADPTAGSDPRYGGQPYADDQITAEGAGSICKANQVLHPEAADLISKIRANDHYVPEVADPLSPTTFVNRINVPVYMACQFTDEQTGGHCPTLAEHMTGTSKKWFTYTNGTHVDSLDPATYERMYDFFKIYVDGDSPGSPTSAAQTAFVNSSWPVAAQAIFGINGPGPCPGGTCPPPAMTLPVDPIQANATVGAAQTAFEALKPIRVMFDNGAGNSSNPGWPYPGFEQSYDSFPIPGTTARSWYFGPDGGLADGPAPTDAADRFIWDAHARPLTDFTGDTGAGTNGLWTPTPPYEWSQDPAGRAVSYQTSPLSQATAVVGAGSVTAWVRSSSPNVDLQATISEIRPDGKETFVQGGWVRGKARALDPGKSTELEPVLSLRQEDFSPLPSDHFVPVTIPLYYEGHMYRAGSQIRVRISAPNGDQPIWSFGETDPPGLANVNIGYGPNMPSKLQLPVVPGTTTSTGLPPCPGLRGEPCRDYQPLVNAQGSLGDEGQGQAGGPAPTSAANATRCKKRKRHHRAAAAKKKRGCKKKRHRHH
jgi:predicted acyl esterase